MVETPEGWAVWLITHGNFLAACSNFVDYAVDTDRIVCKGLNCTRLMVQQASKILLNIPIHPICRFPPYSCIIDNCLASFFFWVKLLRDCIDTNVHVKVAFTIKKIIWFIICYLIKDEQRLSLKMLTCLKRIYNFLYVHTIIISLLPNFNPSDLLG